MSVTDTLNRRTFLSAGASLLASGASLMMLPNVYAASQSGGRPAPEGEHHSDDEMQKCIRLCQECHALCVQTIGHCLKLGGRHSAPEHIRIMQDCLELCEITAHYLIRESSLHGRICGLCAEVCRQCADNCLQIAGDDPMVKKCTEMCRTCAGSCERMADKQTA
jgi:hypothetical protein